MNEMTLDFDSFKVTAMPKIDKVVFVSKWSGESATYTGDQFIAVLERVVEYKRASPEELALLEERDRLKQRLARKEAR